MIGDESVHPTPLRSIMEGCIGRIERYEIVRFSIDFQDSDCFSSLRAGESHATMHIVS